MVEYNRLMGLAARPDKRPDPPPVSAVVARADLKVRVAGDMARGTLRLEGEVFQRGRVRVPLVTGATLLDARTDGVPLPVVHEGDVHAAVLSGPAPFTVRSNSPCPCRRYRSRIDGAAVAGSGERECHHRPSRRSGGHPRRTGIVTRRQTAAARTTVDVTLDPGRPGQMTWSVRETAPVSTAY